MLHPSSREQSLPGLSSPSCHLAAGKHTSLTARTLTSLPPPTHPPLQLARPLLPAFYATLESHHFRPPFPNHLEYCVYSTDIYGQPVLDFTFRGFWNKLKGFFVCFVLFSILPQLKLWILISVRNFVLSPHWLFPSNTLACAPGRRQMCSHGNRTVSALLACQVKPTSVGEEPAGDLTDLTSLQQWESQGGEKKRKTSCF